MDGGNTVDIASYCGSVEGINMITIHQMQKIYHGIKSRKGGNYTCNASSAIVRNDCVSPLDCPSGNILLYNNWFLFFVYNDSRIDLNLKITIT